MPFVPKAPFPNVPRLPGVPQLRRSNLFPAGPPPALTGVIALGRLALALTTKPVWGIYKIEPPAPPVEAPADGGDLPDVIVTPPKPPALVPDSFLRLAYNQEWQISTAPTQEGGFASYNKVANPFEITLRMVKAGSLASRREFLDKLETIAASLDLFRIMTPERAYMNCNIKGFRLVREGQRGAFFFAEVDVSFIEIREVTAQYTSTAQNTQNARNPSALPVKNGGTVNAITPASRVGAAIDKAMAPLRELADFIGAS